MGSIKHKIPNGLEELIKDAAVKAFPEAKNVIKKFKISWKCHHSDYQIHIKSVTNLVNQNANFVVSKIFESVPKDNAIMKNLEASTDGTFMNIFTKIPKPVQCKVCEKGIVLGQSNIDFRPYDAKLIEKINSQLMSKVSDRLKPNVWGQLAPFKTKV